MSIYNVVGGVVAIFQLSQFSVGGCRPILTFGWGTGNGNSCRREYYSTLSLIIHITLRSLF